jgi:plastocyanin
MSNTAFFLLFAAYTGMSVSGGGHVKGRVKLAKSAPQKPALKPDKDGAVCGASIPDETYVVGKDGGFANVVVFIDGIQRGKKIEPKNVDVANQKCRFTPHVAAIAKGTTVNIINSDSTLHNTHAYAKSATLFNMALPKQGQKIEKKIDRTGPVEIKCDVHSWMKGWLYVTDHPYVTVTDAEGNFTLTDVPAGTYQIQAWHEAEGAKKASVTVTAGGTATVDFSY